MFVSRTTRSQLCHDVLLRSFIRSFLKYLTFGTESKSESESESESESVSRQLATKDTKREISKYKVLRSLHTFVDKQTITRDSDVVCNAADVTYRVIFVDE